MTFSLYLYFFHHLNHQPLEGHCQIQASAIENFTLSGFEPLASGSFPFPLGTRSSESPGGRSTYAASFSSWLPLENLSQPTVVTSLSYAIRRAMLVNFVLQWLYCSLTTQGNSMSLSLSLSLPPYFCLSLFKSFTVVIGVIANPFIYYYDLTCCAYYLFHKCFPQSVTSTLWLNLPINIMLNKMILQNLFLAMNLFLVRQNQERLDEKASYNEMM